MNAAEHRWTTRAQHANNRLSRGHSIRSTAMPTGKKSQGDPRGGGKTGGNGRATKPAQKNSSGKSKPTPASGGNKSGATKR